LQHVPPRFKQTPSKLYSRKDLEHQASLGEWILNPASWNLSNLTANTRDQPRKTAGILQIGEVQLAGLTKIL